MDLAKAENGLNDLVGVLSSYFDKRGVIVNNKELKSDIIQTKLKEFDGENFGKMFDSANGLLKMIEAAELEAETLTRRERMAYTPPSGSIEEVGYYLKRQEWRNYYAGEKSKMDRLEKDYQIAIIDSDNPKIQFLEDFSTGNPELFDKYGLHVLHSKMALQIEENRNNRLSPETQKLLKRLDDLKAMKNRVEQVQNVLRHRDSRVLRDALNILQN